jgi:hypothetical protein
MKLAPCVMDVGKSDEGVLRDLLNEVSESIDQSLTYSQIC